MARQYTRISEGKAPVPKSIEATAVVAWQPKVLLRNAAWVVFGASVLLSLIGVHAISITSGLEGGMLSGVALKQAVFLFLGIMVAGVVAAPSYRRLPAFTPLLAAATVGLLVFVLLPFVPESIVEPRNGARRWISLGFTDFQPSELAKVVYVLVLAGYLRYRKNYRRFTGLIPPAIIALVPMSLILVEPDLGTALVFMPALLAMLVAAGAKLWHLFVTCAFGVGFGVVVLAASLFFATRPEPSYPLLRPHQVERIQAVMDTEGRYDHDQGFQGKQARTLVGAGGLTGHSVSKSRALVHFSRVPEPHNDMIFAVVVNRFGLLGGATLLGLYGLWIGGALWVAARCKEPFGRLIVVGFAAIVFTQMFVNVGMTLGILPITGMTLPFVSYGGSSLLMGFVMVGLIFNVAMRRAPYLWQPYFEYDDPNAEPT